MVRCSISGASVLGSGGNLKNLEQTFGEDRKPTLQTLICIAEALNSQLGLFPTDCTGAIS